MIELVCVEVQPGGGGEFVPRTGGIQGNAFDITCNPTCEMLPGIANGMISYSTGTDAPFSLGTVATYVCNSGFQLSGGNQMRNCINSTSGGVFDGSAPMCTPIPGCEGLPPIENGVIMYSPDPAPLFDVGTVAIYTCNEGFRLVNGVGDQIRTCVDDGLSLSFSGTAPLCESSVTICSPPEYLADGVCREICPPGFLGNHQTGECETLPEVFEVLTNASAYFLNVQTDTPLDTVVLDYTLFINEAQIGRPTQMELSLVSSPEIEGVLGFDNGRSIKEYVNSLPESYSVDQRDIGSFQEAIILRGEVPSALLSNGRGVFSVQLNNEVTGSEGDGNTSTSSVNMTVSISDPIDFVELVSPNVTVSEGVGVVSVPIMKEVTADDVLVTVVLEEIQGSARAGDDYGPFPVPVQRLPALLLANQTRLDFGIPIFDDSLVEFTESFRVGLESGDSQVDIRGVASTIIYIEDNDVVEFVIALVDGSPVVTEGNQTLLFNITKLGNNARDINIVVHTEDGTAGGASDFQQLTLPMTFGPSTTVMEFNVMVTNDDLVEGDEMFSVTFDPAPGEMGVTLITDPPVITILDDADVVTVSLSPDVSPVVVREGSMRQVVVQSSGNNEIPVTMVIDVSAASTAVAGEDYFLNVTSLTFDPGETSQIIPVFALSDGLFEADDESLVLIGRPDQSGGRVAVVIDPSASMATIEIEDTDSVRVGFTAQQLTVSEASRLFNVSVELTEGELAVGVVVTMDAAGDLAVVGEDFEFSSTDLTFEPNGPRSLMVEGIISDDEVFEGREGFSLSLTTTNARVTLAPPTQQVLIVDNEDLVVTFSSQVYSVEETEPSLEVRVQLGADIRLQRSITLDLRTRDVTATGGMDFEPVDTTLTFTPDETMVTQTVILLDDEISEGLETFDLDVILVDEVLGEPGVLLTASVLVFDNEDIFVSLSRMEYVVSEGAGFAVITIEKSGITPNNEDTELTLTLTSGSAQAGIDYGPFPFNQPSFQLPVLVLANDTQSLFGISIIDDNLVEGAESFSIAIEISGGRTREEGGIVFLGNITMAMVLIEDNDMINVSLVVPGAVGGVISSTEGVVQFDLSVVRSDDVTLVRNVTVVARATADTAEEGSDFVPIDVTLVFIAGGDETLSFSLMLLDDTVAEGNESFVVELVAADDSAVLATSSLQVEIVDNDVAVVEFAQPSYEAFELDRSVEICLTKNADTAFSFVVSVVPMETRNVPDDVFEAQAGIDFDATPRNVTFDPMDSQKCVMIAVFQDGMPGEGLEVFSLGLVSLAGRAPVEIGSLSTVDVFVNDVPDVILGFQSSAIVRVDEGVGDVEVCVGVFNPAMDELLNTTITLTIETTAGTADESDYEPITPGSLLLTLNDTHRSNCFQVRIRDDDLFEDPSTETFTVSISSVITSNADFRVVTAPANITVAVADDDRRVTIGFRNTSYIVSEGGGSQEVCVAVTTPPLTEMFTSDVVGLLVTTVEGSANGSDYSGFTSRLVGSVSNADREVCFTVAITNDELLETEERFTLTLSAQVPDSANLIVTLDPSVTIIIILDDDLPPTTPTPSLPNVTTPTPPTITTTPTPVTPVAMGNDTVVGDPLFSVPLYLLNDSALPPLSSLLHLCYEIHGWPDTILNLVSDTCTNINAHYTGLIPDTESRIGFNAITRIGVRAQDTGGGCVQVLVDTANNCTPVVMTTRGSTTGEMRYDRDGVVVMKVRNRVRIAVPNCGQNRLVMWVTCQSDRMRFDLTRGIGLAPTSHGLLGQFWNVPISVSRYTYTGDAEFYLDPTKLFAVTVTHPTTGDTRRFIAEYDEQVWDLSNKDCLYAGNVQGGPLGDIRDPLFSDSVIEGDYMQYSVADIFGHDFMYSQFAADQCQL